MGEGADQAKKGFFSKLKSALTFKNKSRKKMEADRKKVANYKKSGAGNLRRGGDRSWKK